MRIAVVDDEAAMREQLVSYISRFGQENGLELKTTVFPSGDAFWERFARDWDIILFDIDMPGTNGIDTARKVRQADEAVTILFITNVAQYAINGYEVDAVDYVIKPIGYYDFALKFTKALRRVGRQGSRRLLLDTTKGRVALEAKNGFRVDGISMSVYSTILTVVNGLAVSSFFFLGFEIIAHGILIVVLLFLTVEKNIKAEQAIIAERKAKA